ncbi:hypothetical protein EYF80_046662 [Liparis tanakae]|uniref:Uncharacterized protein n=1 Tax=Liparis tanakae TaxID=230148 RepID=A0A4Z2FQI0_9TELE|nr:hypothetical protein EYF80_046662 [Liparis tanakae]
MASRFRDSLLRTTTSLSPDSAGRRPTGRRPSLAAVITTQTPLLPLSVCLCSPKQTPPAASSVGTRAGEPCAVVYVTLHGVSYCEGGEDIVRFLPELHKASCHRRH